MISCLWLERPGKWRAIGVVVLWTCAAVPALPLFWQGVAHPAAAVLGAAFGAALWNSALVAVLVAVIALGLGLPSGVLTALYEFRGRQSMLMLATLPLLLPSFLW